MSSLLSALFVILFILLTSSIHAQQLRSKRTPTVPPHKKISPHGSPHTPHHDPQTPQPTANPTMNVPHIILSVVEFVFVFSLLKWTNLARKRDFN